MGFFDFLFRKRDKKDTPIEYEPIEMPVEQNNPKFNRSRKEENLISNFYERHQEKTIEFEGRITKYLDIKNESHSEQAAIYRDCLSAFYEYRKFATSKGKGGTMAFQDMWEHNHNSKNTCFSTEDVLIKAIDSLTELDSADKLIFEYVDRHPGTLQKELPSLLSLDKDIVNKVLRQNKYEKKKIKGLNAIYINGGNL